MINIQSERRIFGLSEDIENYSPGSNREKGPENKELRRLSRAVSDSYCQKQTRVSLKPLEKYIETPLCHTDELLYLRDFTSIPLARGLSRSLSLQDLDSLPSHLFEKSVKGKDSQYDLSTHSFLPTIAHEQLIELLENEGLWGENPSCTLAEALTKRGYSKEVRDLDLSLYGNRACWKEIRNLEGITFVNCTFNWEPDFDTSVTTCFLGQEGQVNLKNVIFKNCHFYHVCWMEFSFVDCIFDQCEMEGVLFVGAALENVHFRECCLTGCSFEDAILIRCVFILTHMPCTHFLDAYVKETTIRDSNLTQVQCFAL